MLELSSLRSLSQQGDSKPICDKEYKLEAQASGLVSERSTRLRFELVSVLKCALVLATWMFAGSYASAQSTTSRGLFGDRTLGGSLGAGSRSFGGSSASGNAGANNGTAGQITGGERFVRGNRQPGQFVGADSADATNFISALSGGGLGPNARSFSTPRGQAARAAVNRAASNTKQKRSVQARLMVAFAYHRLNGVDVGATLTRRLNRSKRIRSTSLLYVEVKDRTAVLRGHVATKNDRAVAGQLAMLEAGVSRVRNELKVSPSPAKTPAKKSPKPAEQTP